MQIRYQAYVDSLLVDSINAIRHWGGGGGGLLFGMMASQNVFDRCAQMLRGRELKLGDS